MQPSPGALPLVHTVSSFDAYVLPHLVDVAPEIDGVVARVFVREREVVSATQPLLEVARGPERSIVTSSVRGVVSRCRVRVGDAAAPGRPLLSIVRADDVLVVARFDLSAEPALWNGKLATVRIPRATARPLGATLVCVTTGHPWSVGAERHEPAAVRVVARLHSAPPAALWPGIEAIVDVEDEPSPM
jgi:pyruvate/2-oxoglutarate dehydrogenase complex dihydrolipoamide acyltransferase (E2) component